MREINRMIFFGAGSTSRDAVNHLKQRLDDAVSTLGGLQQPGHPESEEEAKQEELFFAKANADLKDMISDIISAFGYDPSDMTWKELPY